MLGNKITLHRSVDQGATYGDAIGEITDIQAGDKTSETVDSTTYGGDHDFKEYDYALKAGGDWTITVRLKTDQSDADAFEDAHDNSTKEFVQFQFPSPISKTISFRCLITSVGRVTSKESHVDRTFTLMVDGAPIEADLT